MIRQRGFALVMAMFILIMLALLGAYMSRFISVQQVTPAYTLQGSRAYQAAKAGLGWAVARIKAGGTCADVSQTGFTLAGLPGFSMTITCSVNSYQEGTLTPQIYNLTARSEFGSYAGVDYVSRNVGASLCQGC